MSIVTHQQLAGEQQPQPLRHSNPEFQAPVLQRYDLLRLIVSRTEAAVTAEDVSVIKDFQASLKLPPEAIASKDTNILPITLQVQSPVKEAPMIVAAIPIMHAEHDVQASEALPVIHDNVAYLADARRKVADESISSLERREYLEAHPRVNPAAIVAIAHATHQITEVSQPSLAVFDTEPYDTELADIGYVPQISDQDYGHEMELSDAV